MVRDGEARHLDENMAEAQCCASFVGKSLSRHRSGGRRRSGKTRALVQRRQQSVGDGMARAHVRRRQSYDS
jgi:hypothetical protein